MKNKDTTRNLTLDQAIREVAKTLNRDDTEVEKAVLDVYPFSNRRRRASKRISREKVLETLCSGVHPIDEVQARDLNIELPAAIIIPKRGWGGGILIYPVSVRNPITGDTKRPLRASLPKEHLLLGLDFSCEGERVEGTSEDQPKEED